MMKTTDIEMMNQSVSNGATATLHYDILRVISVCNKIFELGKMRADLNFATRVVIEGKPTGVQYDKES